ncbi:hypothetical protein D9M71_632370 [compost metagenome]
MVVLAGSRGKVPISPLTASPVSAKVRPPLRATRIRAEALLITETAYCAELASRLRLRWVSTGTRVVPSACNWETTRLKSLSGLRTPVCCTLSRRPLPQVPGLAAPTSRTGSPAPLSSTQALVPWPTATRTIRAWVPPLRKNCRTP